MALTEYQHLQIEKYLSGNMTPGEEIVFFSEVAADDEWQTEFEFQKMLHGKQDIYSELPAHLQEIEKDSVNYQQNKAMVAAIAAAADASPDLVKAKPVVSLFKNKWLVAASVLVLAVLSGLIFYQQASKPTKDIADKKVKKTGTVNETADSVLLLAFAQNYQTYQPGDNIPPDISNAVVSYKTKQYQLAANEFSETVTTRGNSSGQQKIEAYSQFYKGLCMLELDKPGEAYSLIKKAFSSKKAVPEIAPEIEWYYALICLKQEKKEEAIEVLTNLASGSNSKYKDKAASILQQVK